LVVASRFQRHEQLCWLRINIGYIENVRTKSEPLRKPLYDA
jgi:hypothetical protein